MYYRYEERTISIILNTPGEDIIHAGGSLAIVGGALLVLGLGDDMSVVGVADDVITLPGGTTISAIGAVLTATGYLYDWIADSHPMVRDYKEIRDSKWIYKKTDESCFCAQYKTKNSGLIPLIGDDSFLPKRAGIFFIGERPVRFTKLPDGSTILE